MVKVEHKFPAELREGRIIINSFSNAGNFHYPINEAFRMRVPVVLKEGVYRLDLENAVFDGQNYREVCLSREKKSIIEEGLELMLKAYIRFEKKGMLPRKRVFSVARGNSSYDCPVVLRKMSCGIVINGKRYYSCYK